MFKRKTLTPALINSLIFLSESVAGPTVATIFVRRQRKEMLLSLLFFNVFVHFNYLYRLMQQAWIRVTQIRDMNRTHPPSTRRKTTYTDGGNADIAGAIAEEQKTCHAGGGR